MTQAMQSCLLSVRSVSQDDRSEIRSRIAEYQSSGMDETQAEITAISDILAEAKSNQAYIAQMIGEQHADLVAGVKTEKVGADNTADTELEKRILFAADSIKKLRKVDVERVLMQGNIDQKAMADYIKRNRPEFAAEVDDVMADAPKSADTVAKEKADQDFDDALADLGDIFGANFRATLLPEQEQKLIPVLTRLMDAAFRKGYYKFKDAARFVLQSIRKSLGDNVANVVTIDHLQGAYIGMAGKYQDQGADSKRDVISVETKEEIEKADSTDGKWVLRRPDNGRLIRDAITSKPRFFDSKESAQSFADSIAQNDKPKTFSNSSPFAPRPERATPEMAQSVEKEDVNNERSSTDLERDRQDTKAQDGMGEEDIRPGRDGDDGAGRQGMESPATAGDRLDGGERVPGRETSTAGERGDQQIYTGAVADEASIARDYVNSGSDSSGLDGSPIEPESTEFVDELAASGLSIEQAQKAQADADKKDHKPGLANIRETLPILLDGQQEDVFKAETRFAKPDGYGMLFTNGTGTGKTFTGLGIIKRHVTAGKKNVIIVVPNDKIASDWQKSGTLLDLNITRLEDTKDAGSGVVITTYANFGQNNSLASRQWDLVVTDESQYLAMDKDGTNTLSLKALRAITYHPQGAIDRAQMLYADEYAEAKALSESASSMRKSDDQQQWYEAGKVQDKADAIYARLRDKEAAIKEEIKNKQGIERTRALFLSATPFAYEKTVDWANGYLFDYNEGRGNEESEYRGYNQGSNRDQFMMQHFGYRMRYGKLTDPDAKVDRGLMQRQFNTWLKKSGSLSGRMLDVKADYDRRFILVDSAIGQRIDEALQWFDAKRKSGDDRMALGDLRDAIGEKFDYLSRRYLLEAIKAREVIPHVKEHMAMGRKVVVFHDYKKGGGFNPFNVSKREGDDSGEFNQVVDEFRAEFKDLINSELFKASSPIEAFKKEFPGALIFNGDVSPKDRRAAVEKFQDDASGPQVILVQSAAGKEGISLHDTTGKHQRVLFNLGQPTQPTTAIQQEGRIYRTGQVTDAIFRYLNTGTNWEKWAFATTIAQRASAAENLGMGEQARALKDAFISGFEESGDYRAGMEDEGKGGKERDRLANNALTEYDRARAFYFGTQKKTSKTKAQEGADYFATPEPIGLKMVQFADIRPGESVLEPSAGHGAIARWFPDTAQKRAIEPSMALRPRLAMVFDGDIVDSDFESHNIVNKYDAIVLNPPFGSGGKTAIEHLHKATRHVRDGGRVVALIPRGEMADKRFDKWMYEESEVPAKPLANTRFGDVFDGDTVVTDSDKYKNATLRKVERDIFWVKFPGDTQLYALTQNAVKSINPTGKRTKMVRPSEGMQLVADIVLPSSTFERAGTAVNTRIVVLEKTNEDLGYSQKSPSYDNATDINDLFNRIEDLELPPRKKAVAAEPESPKEAKAKKADERAQALANEEKAKESGVIVENAAEATFELKNGKIVTNAPTLQYTTKNGKVLTGVLVPDKTMAKSVDKWSWHSREWGGKSFVRIEHIERPSTKVYSKSIAIGDSGLGDDSITPTRSIRSIAEILQSENAEQVLVRGENSDALNKIARLFGKKIIFFRTVGIDRSSNEELGVRSGSAQSNSGTDGEGDSSQITTNGFVVPGRPGLVFLNSGGNNHLSFILGHELAHTLRQDDPGLWNQLARDLIPLLKNFSQYKSENVQDITDDSLALEELVGDVVGDNFLNPEFWSEMAGANETIFGKVARKAIELLNKAIRVMIGVNVGNYVTDLKKARSIIAKTMVEYSNNARNGMYEQWAAEAQTDTVTVDGVEYQANNAVGQAIHPTKQGTVNFWRWFNGVRSGRMDGSAQEGTDASGALRYGDGVTRRDWATDERGRPVVFFHGTKDSINHFDLNHPNRKDNGWLGDGVYAITDRSMAKTYANIKRGAGEEKILSLYMAVRNPYIADVSLKSKLQKASKEAIQRWSKQVQDAGYDGVVLPFSDGYEIMAFNPMDVKSVDNDGTFGDTDQIRYSKSKQSQISIQAASSEAVSTSRAIPNNRQTKAPLDGGQNGKAEWDLGTSDFWRDQIYKFQNKHVDLKDTIEAIKKTGQKIRDVFNPYQQEELYHKRVAKRTEDFFENEFNPLLVQMRMNKVGREEFEQYLHARHAKEANELIRSREGMEDGGSGMTDKEVDDYFSKLPADKKKTYESLAKHIDSMITKTRQTLADYGLESQGTVDSWANMFEHYVPLNREDMEEGSGIGQGFSVKGPASKHRTGSSRKVADILANIAQARDRAIVRGEKNKVAVALYGLAYTNPNPDVWELDKAPQKAVLKDGKVATHVDPNYKNRENVVVARIKDSKGNVVDRAIVFNESNDRAKRMAAALKNLDTPALEGLIGISGKITRYMSAMSTQYNPVFVAINFARDFQGAAVNLSSTPLKGKQAEVMKHAMSALIGIYSDLRAHREGRSPESKWAELYEEMQLQGGTTGYRDAFGTASERSVEQIEKLLDPEWWAKTGWGKVITANGLMTAPEQWLVSKPGAAMMNWISDLNETAENAMRLSVYKTALDHGLSKQESASIAKNITVNFNRKGQVGSQMNAAYAFFNAAVQGTARLKETMVGPAGKQIIAGGLILGVAQALALLAAGLDDDEPQEFVKEKNLIIPLGGKHYAQIPMPLGLHVIPGVGRIATEFVMHGFKDPGKHAGNVISMIAGAFNPVGSSASVLQMLSPTPLDPLVALAENKDWTGKQIYKEDFSKLDPTPGHMRTRDTATIFSKKLAEALNYISGGTDYTPGWASPTPDQIDYLVGQATGGVGRELGKAMQTGESMITGEALPPYKIPLVGRFYGKAEGAHKESSAFYDNLKEINIHHNEVKGRASSGGDVSGYVKDNPEASLYAMAKNTEKQVAFLRRQKRRMISEGAEKTAIKAKEEQISSIMKRLNDRMRAIEEAR